MNRMKRWTMSVTSWVDGVLAQVENHEVAVSSAIGRARQATARARVQLKRVERDQQALRTTLLEEEEAIDAWRRRAKAADDDTVALECLRRHKAAERRVLRLRQRLAEHERSHKELSDGVGVLNGRLSELTERKNMMRTRQSRAEAAHGMASTTGPIGDLEDVFERWEARVGEIEIASDCAEPIDLFEAELEAVEDTAKLRIELEELRAERR
jgi:phage shock protein A